MISSHLVLVGAHGALAEDELGVAVSLGEVTSLLVVLGTLAALHHKGSVGGSEVSEEGEVHGSPKVVAIRDGHVLDAIGKEGVELREERGGLWCGKLRTAVVPRNCRRLLLTFPDPTRAA